jgi:carboxymethylenebutenolidase
MSLPNAKPFKLTSNVTIQAPLSRQGHGPGLLIIRSAAKHDQLNIKKTLDPEPLQKWAEESYVIAQLEVSEGHTTIKEELRQALDALENHERCSKKASYGIIGNCCSFDSSKAMFPN